MEIIQQTAFTGADGIQLTTVPDKQPTATQIQLKTAYTPVLPWDWRSATGELAGLNPARPPYVLSYALSGIVTAVGQLRRTTLLGQRLLTVNFHGSAREQNLLAPSPLVLPVPDQVSLAAATTLIGGADAAVKLMQAAKIHAGMTVLVTGAAGGVGSYLVQLLHQQGATVLALSRPANRDWLTQLGANDTIDYTTDLTTQLQAAPKATALLDTVGNTQLLNSLAAGQPQLQVWSIAQQNWQPLAATQAFHFVNGPIWPQQYRRLLDQLATGQLTAAIAATYDFHDVRQAQQAAQQPGQRGRTLLRYSH